MAKIDFYVIQIPGAKPRLDLICRLAEKAYKNKHRIYIHANNQTEAYQLDELLWTYREDSFLPHNLVGEGPNLAPPIQIGFKEKPENHRDILLNLHQAVPEFYSHFTRVLELVPNDDESQAIAREHYRFYRAAGYDITTHKLSSVEI
jgi:DNA polymerase-3 subunit chi